MNGFQKYVFAAAFLLAATILRPADYAAADKTYLGYLRNLYKDAIQNESIVDVLMTDMAARYQNAAAMPPLIRAYSGALDSLKAKFGLNPYSRLTNVLEAVGKLDSAVAEDPENLEIRFIRFSVLHELPGYFKIDVKRDDDKDTVCRIIISGKTAAYPSEFVNTVIDFMTQSRRLSSLQESLIGSMKK